MLRIVSAQLDGAFERAQDHYLNPDSQIPFGQEEEQPTQYKLVGYGNGKWRPLSGSIPENQVQSHMKTLEPHFEKWRDQGIEDVYYRPDDGGENIYVEDFSSFPGADIDDLDNLDQVSSPMQEQPKQMPMPFPR